jgi:hypothetical protein
MARATFVCLFLHKRRAVGPDLAARAPHARPERGGLAQRLARPRRVVPRPAGHAARGQRPGRHPGHFGRSLSQHAGSEDVQGSGLSALVEVGDRRFWSTRTARAILPESFNMWFDRRAPRATCGFLGGPIRVRTGGPWVACKPGDRHACGWVASFVFPCRLAVLVTCFC